MKPQQSKTMHVLSLAFQHLVFLFQNQMRVHVYVGGSWLTTGIQEDSVYDIPHTETMRYNLEGNI